MTVLFQGEFCAVDHDRILANVQLAKNLLKVADASRGANLNDQSLEFKPALIKALVVDRKELEELLHLHNVAGMLDWDGNVVDASEAARNEVLSGAVEFVED